MSSVKIDISNLFQKLLVSLEYSKYIFFNLKFLKQSEIQNLFN